jgi:outer membrane protein with beta-barrel domain
LRTLFISLVVLATGCATTPPAKTASQRLAELKREREAQAAGQAPSSEQATDPVSQSGGNPAEESQPSTPAISTTEPTSANAPEAPAAPAAPEAPPAPEAPAASTAPEAPAAPVTPEAPFAREAPAASASLIGPRHGLFGIRGTLFGSGLGLPTVSSPAGTVSTVGIRYFLNDWVGMAFEAGFAIATEDKRTDTGLAVGFGLNLYGGTPGDSFRPYFAAELGATSLTGSEREGSTSVAVSAGGGLEYWLVPQLSVNAGLMLSVAVDPEHDAVFLGTVRPGLGVTLYTR